MKLFKAVLAALPLLVSLLLLPAVHASTLSPGSGSFTTTGEVISIRQADGNTIVTATEVQTLTGVLTGTRLATGIQIFHPDGTFTAHDTGTFTGTVDGRTGSITISGASSGAGNTGSGQIVGDRGTGGLAGLHLQGTFQPVITSATTADGTYSAQFHFVRAMLAQAAVTALGSGREQDVNADVTGTLRRPPVHLVSECGVLLGVPSLDMGAGRRVWPPDGQA